ncbi:MAG: RsmB/NOP family class I SAM-dependent RNA methyltransferase [Nanoarchaeota archaeon]|nr:RsmB/NOP family class I SAM-dependent RNA methyltransferase [Nanoarchaeota archaeon]MBU1854375.1 RsmB/NOP family class I SAM-dependent RNA methyltransferase [Nanoarchaeota archaeon]
MLETIPRTEDTVVKEKFVERYKSLLGNKYDEFIKYSFSYIRKTVRVNTLKIGVSNLKKQFSDDWNMLQVPWCKEGFWVDYKREKRFDIGNTPEHQLGYIYVQDAASMIPAVVLQPKPGEKILDMCAAPGSKTTQIAQYMNNTGVVIANDPNSKRLAALGINLSRCGVSNTVITHQQGTFYRKLEFDRVLVDAPCSATGTIRKSLKSLAMWSPGLVRKMVSIQKQLIEAGFLALKKGGVMVYSTCTLEPEEDEGMVSYLLNRHSNAQLQEIKLDINRSESITSFEKVDFNPEVKKCLRIYPQDNNTEGFFIARIKKL